MASQHNSQQSSGLDCFLKYINFHPLNEEELNLAMGYIDNNLKGNLITDQGYWYDMYSYSVKNFWVLKHKQKNNVSLTTLGECLCQEKVINFLKNIDKKCLCNKGCSSVYYNRVF